ncbi:TorF family putative porin [Corallincola platygyrae]|uniref:TorF family putative porin n=1 Tax=Corallincola platygyrae TaxID=1193278 RepID=A0ABW4XN14_9GAMM
MKKALSLAISSVLGVAALASSNAHAVEGLSANVGLTSNYLWRGVTQTDDAAAVSGGIDYEHASGIYVGTWASNVDFNDDQASYELDFYGGYAGEIGDFGYDVGYIYYAYPDADEDNLGEYDFGEVYGGVSWQWFGVSAAYTTNHDVDELEDALYLEATAEFEIADGLTLGFAVGNFDFDDDSLEDYVNYNASLTKSTDAGDFTFMLSDTDIDNDDMVAVVSYSIGIDL